MAIDQVFPAPAGMNRLAPLPGCSIRRVPRASGDEPTDIRTDVICSGCSPRQRG